MSFFDFLSPHLRQLETDKVWLREQLERTSKELYAERRRNLKREDALVNQLALANGGRKLPLRFEEDAPAVPKPDEESKGLPPSSEAALRQRAREYAEQRAEGEITESVVEEAFQMMLGDPEYWLKDE